MNDITRQAELFKALSDPNRLKILQFLADEHAMNCGGRKGARIYLCVNALAKKLGVTQSAVSQHLRLLKHAGLVNGERRGSFIHYYLDREGWKRARAAFDALGVM
jgi:DNA-binding transcriptional ArsR family regulator